MSDEDLKLKARQAMQELFDTMQQVLGLPSGFAIQMSDELLLCFNSNDPEKLRKFIQWAEYSTASLK